ncbi:DUF1496 domain-containing protein (plasmid) [Pseudoalteromonas sp. T1lg65]|uniref:DUF1496 domain-containing protein n=1 Tax=Pseudoalteromonas sp. T1lg65 TaxID=2077101 RepID=UPI003F79EF8D
MMKYLPAAIMSSLVSISVYAKAPVQPHFFSDLPKRVCWFASESYSEGAIISQFDMLFVCAPKKPFEDNGELIWVKATSSGEPIRPEKESRIRVN